MKIFLRKKDGYILTWVLCFFLIVAVISVTTMSFAVMSTQSTVIQHNKRQAQFTAKSAVVATVNYVSENASDASAINRLMLQPGTGSDESMGDYSVALSYVNANKIKVTATAEYNGQKASSTAYLVRSSTSSLKGIIPADNVIYINGNATEIERLKHVEGNVFVDGRFTNFSADGYIAGALVARGDSSFSGNAKITTEDGVYVMGNLSMKNSDKILGDLFVKGTLDISGSSYVVGDVLVDNGDMSLLASSYVNGDVRVKGNMIMDGGGANVNGNLFLDGNAKITGSAAVKTSSSDPANSGNIYAKGSLDLSGNWVTSIYGNAYIGENISFTSQSYIKKKLYYGGTPNTTSWGATVEKIALEGAARLSNDFEFDSIPKIDPSSFEPPELPIIEPPTYAKMPTLYTAIAPITATNTKITTSGMITSATFAEMRDGTVVTIEAKSSDICLLLDNTDFKPGKNSSFQVVSENGHNVYIFMKGNSTFELSANQYMGMDVRGTNPRLYIIGNGSGTQVVNLTSNSELDACLYLPQGRLEVEGAPLTTYKFIGISIIKELKTNGDSTFCHSVPPDLENSELAFLTVPGGSSTGIDWVIGNWGEN